MTRPALTRMFRARLAAAAAMSVVTLMLALGPGVVSAAPSTFLADKPNIVVFLLDDTNPMDGRLWNDPSLTPAIYDHFVAHGTTFSNAIDDTSLCCPARATLLTGLHSFNTGVTANDVRLFNPGESIATELTKSGYETMLVGKYMNLPEYLTGDLWTQNAAPWSVFDVFTSKFNPLDGYFYNYTMTTKDGQVLTPLEHSTQLITERAVAHMAATDPSKPIFAELSVVDTHLPNYPMPGFENDPRWAQCASMPPWDPPNYNQADLSDKPAFVQKLPLLPYPDGWPMATYCQEMLGVDWMVQQVTNELQAEGRLDNTLLVFTADNGMAWGQHRLSLKEVPYSTRVPLYMSWPARWGTDPRTVDEYTSNIDLAPTFCAAAGCTLGPYPTGQTKPDGVSLLPVLDGAVEDLGRDALLETEWRVHPWAAVRTTDLNDLGLWHYVEYASGFRELYNMDPDEDPWELNNLAYDPAYSDIVAQLSDRLDELLAEGRQAGMATVTIVEDSLPNNPQDFSYSGGFGSFALDDGGDAALPRKRVFLNVTPGTYTISQAPAPSWTLSSIACPPGSDINLSSGTVSLHVQPGEKLLCTFRNSRRGPDLSIAQADVGPFKGTNIYSSTPLKRETQKRTGVAAGFGYDYWVAVQNDGKEIDSFTVGATMTNSIGMTVSFWSGGIDVTPDIVAGTFSTGFLAPAASMTLLVHVDVAVDAPVGSRSTVIVRGTSASDPTAVDVVRAFTVH
jgi:N-acetylglucosamine-6-sulfatase